MRFILLEDDPVIGEVITTHIKSENNTIDWVQTTDEFNCIFFSTNYDLLLLDLMLPDACGIDVLKSLRKSGSVCPVIVISALSQIDKKIEALSAGADDFICKPVNINELSARIGSVLRRYSGNPNPLIPIGNIDVNIANRTVFKAGARVHLTAQEWVLFELLVMNPNRLISKATLEEKLYPFDVELQSNTIEAKVSRIRKKLGRNIIKTERNLGYKLGA